MKSPLMGFIALTILFGFFTVLAALLYGAFNHLALEGTVRDVLLVMLGTLGGMATSVVGYYFGSSKGSTAKDETIKVAVDQAAAIATNGLVK